MDPHPAQMAEERRPPLWLISVATLPIIMSVVAAGSVVLNRFGLTDPQGLMPPALVLLIGLVLMRLTGVPVRLGVGVHALLGAMVAAALRLVAAWLPFSHTSSSLGALALAPIAEEVYFRGFLQRSVEMGLPIRWGSLIALLLSAAVFALFHMGGIWRTSFAFLSGMAFGWLFRRSGGLAAPIAAHLLHNVSVGLLQEGAP